MFIAVSMLCSSAEAQVTIVVGSGQTLTEADLVSGSFGGSSFSLSPDTTIEIDSGGLIGPLGDLGFGSNPNRLVDLGGATINFNQGGFAAGTLGVSNATINVFEGGDASSIITDSSTIVNLRGGFAGGRNTDGGVFNIFSGTLANDGSYERGTTVNMFGGIGCEDCFFSDSTLNIQDGELFSGIDIVGGVANVDGGIIGNRFVPFSGGVVNYRGGDIRGPRFGVGAGGTANLFAGDFDDSYRVERDGIANIFGGSIGEEFEADPGSEVNLYVLEASINGISLALTPNLPLQIDTRDGALLEATLSDGSFLDFTLNANRINGSDWFSTDALLTINAVPEPSTNLIFLFAILVSLSCGNRLKTGCRN